MTALDPRLNAFRPDLADIALKGRVEAVRFVSGEAFRVAAPQAPVRRAPSPDAPLETGALRGELVSVFETNADGWCWAQLAADRYVGWIPREALAEPGPNPTHRVSALRTFAFARPDIKSPPLEALPLGAAVTAIGRAEDGNARYAEIKPAGFVVEQHLSMHDTHAADFVETAEKFLGTPYLWGGKTSLGIDCSGLLQVALTAAGIAAPRDTYMQQREVGRALLLDGGLPPLRRGDLVFWAGHVGIMADGESLLHANVHHMQVAVEPLESALARYKSRGVALACIRRIGDE